VRNHPQRCGRGAERAGDEQAACRRSTPAWAFQASLSHAGVRKRKPIHAIRNSCSALASESTLPFPMNRDSHGRCAAESQAAAKGAKVSARAQHAGISETAASPSASPQHASSARRDARARAPPSWRRFMDGLAEEAETTNLISLRAYRTDVPGQDFPTPAGRSGDATRVPRGRSESVGRHRRQGQVVSGWVDLALRLLNSSRAFSD